MSFYLTNNL